MTEKYLRYNSSSSSSAPGSSAFFFFLSCEDISIFFTKWVFIFNDPSQRVGLGFKRNF